ncbi:MAG: insulinase family protein [Bacilli bacterium]|nr:insulinase family protein [Bacilli bacterium]
MITRELKDLNIKIYEEDLDNGLKVILLPFEKRTNYALQYITRYGSEIDEFISSTTKKRIKAPYGVAHFLEHKMFEQEDGLDPFAFYSKTGTDANASTGYKLTSYIVEGTTNIEENLEFLINYVNSPYFTDKNVEKEKGIIIEELNMYLDEPENRLFDNNNKSVFVKHPMRRDIGGTPKSVSKITKEVLYECYNTFYQPDNMLITIAGNFNIDTVMNIIKNNKKLKDRKKIGSIKTFRVKEPIRVNRKEKRIKIKNLFLPKFILTFKKELKETKAQDIYKFKTTTDILLFSLFGSSSYFRERMQANDMYSLFFTSCGSVDNIFLTEFIAETKKVDELKDEIVNLFLNGEITPDDLERGKRVMISNEIIDSDSPFKIMDKIVDDLIEKNEMILNRIEIIRSITMDDLIKVRKEIINESKDNYSFVVAYPKE